MPPLVFNLKETDDVTDAVHLAVEFLTAGKIVAFPTETVYGIAANALSVEGARRLREIKSRGPAQPFTVAINSHEDILDYAPNLSPLVKRLARRCWPGPLTLVIDASHPDSVVRQFPEEVQEMVLKDGFVGLRVPAHDIYVKVSRLTVGPMLLTSANFAGEPDCTSGQEVVDCLQENVDLVLDDGSARYGQASTVVKVDQSSLEILRAGVFSEVAMKRMSSFMALMVCTGNTCRSPMAELLMKKRLAEKLETETDNLEDKGVVVASAGIAAMPGDKASPESVEVMKNMGLDLTNHDSQRVSEQLLFNADLILTMTNGHRQAIISNWPELSDRTHVINIDQTDISDPIGGPLSLYESCAKQIDEQIKSWIDKIDIGISS